jgi:hypothetical protein
MNINFTKAIPVVLAALVAGSMPARAQTSELDQVKAAMEQMQKTMADMQKRIDQLEKEKAQAASTNAGTNAGVAAAAAAGASAAASQSVQTMDKIASGQEVSHPTAVTDRGALNDQQEGAPRQKDYTLDPKFRGFVPVPNTPVLIKFNAKPRVDLTSDNRNSGNNDRFATATIPVKTDPNYGGSEVFNVNARGSALSLDVRAPDVPGDPRFYYNNDFFGSGSGMSYRLKHLYGSYYNVTAGFTYSVFEDPDAWPDTVDFEGPNGVIFARRALVRYLLPVADNWQLNFGVEAPSTELDAGSTADTVNVSSRAPDTTMNVRWENAKVGHAQFSGVLRDLTGNGPITGNQSVVGWGLSLADSINVFDRDSFQTQLTYGHGIFRYINDDFINNDAAYDAGGNLTAIPCFAAVVGYTHVWCDQFRSTASYGYVHLDNEITQGGNAYHITHYGSVNLVYQIRQRLSVGLEALYGKKEVQSGVTGDVWRIQTGLVYTLF